MNTASDTHAEQRHDDDRQPRRRVDTQPRASRASTHTNTQPQRLGAAATRRRCTSSSTCHETAPQPILKLLRIATAAVRLLPLTAAATVHCSAVPHTTQQHNTCTQRSETRKHAQSTAKTIPRSAVPSHSSHSETRCSDAHATTQIRNRNTTAAQRPTHCARASAVNARPTRASYVAHG